MGDLLAVSAGRVAGGIAILGCVAAIALAAGGPGVFGRLGSLLGRDGASLEIAKHVPSAADILAAPTAADRAAALRSLTRPPRRDGGTGSPRRGSRAPSPPAPRAPSSSPAPAIPPPAPGPNAPPSLPPPSPAPSPGSGQVVTTVGDAVKRVIAQAPPETQPLTKPLNDAVDTLVRACRGLPACP